MLYKSPQLEEADALVLDLINSLKDRLKTYTHYAEQQKRWLGTLRRTSFARNIRGSNSIEGYNATLDQAVAAVDNDPPMDEHTETWLAVKGYRDALTYIMQAAKDPTFEFSKQFLKSLHFMMVGYDMSKYPGQWRPGSIFIVDTRTGETVYEAPDVEYVNPLIEELVDYLKKPSPHEPTLVRAAMAHLNLTMIHPFKDGNGRMARALQTLIIAKDGILYPAFSSIEEWLGNNTDAYYDVLAATGQGKWNPQRSALDWVRFCLKGHYQQALVILRRIEESGAIYEAISKIVMDEDLHERMAMPLFDAAIGLSLTNSRYRAETEVSQVVASRDLARLCEAGLLDPFGERKGRTYRAAKRLQNLREQHRLTTILEDPYNIVTKNKSKEQVPDMPLLPGVK